MFVSCVNVVSEAIIVVICIKMTLTQSFNDAVNLKRHLFENTSYDSSVRPALNQSQPTEVKIKLYMTSITSFDMDSGILTFNGHVVVTWEDEIHTWEKADFGGLSRLAVADYHIWTPRLRQLAHYSYDFIVSSVWLHSNGTINFILGGGFIAYCDLNNYAYPYDKQSCTSTIIASEQDASELNLTLMSEMDTSGFNHHGGWEIIDPRAMIVRKRDKDFDMDFVAHILTLTLKRRPDVIMLHSAVPFVLTAVLNTMIYFVPVRSGERISFAITILLTFVFFTTSIVENLPKTALTIPLISKVMAFMNCLCAFNVLVSVLFSRLANECIAPVPECLKRFSRRVYFLKINALLRNFGPGNRDQHLSEEADKSEEPFKEDRTEANLKSQAEKDCNCKNAYEFEITWATIIDTFDVIIFFALLCFVVLVGVAAVILIYGINAGDL